MKIRNGFVSNSSSTSFCILGINAYEEEGPIDKLCRHIAHTCDSYWGGYYTHKSGIVVIEYGYHDFGAIGFDIGSKYALKKGYDEIVKELLHIFSLFNIQVKEEYLEVINDICHNE